MSAGEGNYETNHEWLSHARLSDHEKESMAENGWVILKEMRIGFNWFYLFDVTGRPKRRKP